MELGKHSRNRLLGSLNHWRVVKDFAVPMHNYLVYGFEPGGFFKGWYARDAMAIVHSHSANTVDALKDLSKWMLNCMPHESWGSYDRVHAWVKMPADQRRKILVDCDLVYTEEQETFLILKGEPTNELEFYY